MQTLMQSMTKVEWIPLDGGTYMGKVASFSIVERNWSTYSFIHSVKHNRLSSKKAEDLVYVHNNWGLLACKDLRYKKGPEKLWDVLLEIVDLDMTVQDLARIALPDVEEDAKEEDMTTSDASGTGFSLDSTDEDVDIGGDEAMIPHTLMSHLTLKGICFFETMSL